MSVTSEAIRERVGAVDETVPFDSENVEEGQYAIGSTGTVLHVKKWTRLEKEGEEEQDFAACRVWRPDDEDIVVFLERLLRDDDGYYDPDGEKLLSRNAFEPTDGECWVFTEDNVKSALSKDSEEQEDKGKLLQDEIIAKAQQRERDEVDAQQVEATVEEGDIKAVPDEFIKDDDNEAEAEEDDDDVTIKDSEGFRTDEWDSRAYDAQFYNYIRERGPQDMQELEKVVLTEEIFGKQVEDEDDVRPRIIEAIDVARDEGFALKLEHEGGPDERVVVGEETDIVELEVEGGYHNVLPALKASAASIFNHTLFEDIPLIRATVIIETSDGIVVKATEDGNVNK